VHAVFSLNGKNLGEPAGNRPSSIDVSPSLSSDGLVYAANQVCDEKFVFGIQIHLALPDNLRLDRRQDYIVAALATDRQAI